LSQSQGLIFRVAARHTIWSAPEPRLTHYSTLPVRHDTASPIVSCQTANLSECQRRTLACRAHWSMSPTVGQYLLGPIGCSEGDVRAPLRHSVFLRQNPGYSVTSNAFRQLHVVSQCGSCAESPECLHNMPNEFYLLCTSSINVESSWVRSAAFDPCNDVLRRELVVGQSPTGRPYFA